MNRIFARSPGSPHRPFSRIISHSLPWATALAVWLVPHRPESTAYGFGVKGQFRLGGYSSQVKLDEDPQGLGHNDSSVISSRLHLDLIRLNRSGDEVTIDIRDDYDFFGKSDRELLELQAENQLEIREAAYRNPWEYNRLYYTVGRFTLPEANIYTNDGAEVGYRLTRASRVGGFLGVANEDIVSPDTVTPDYRGFNGNQGGIYYIYENKGSRFRDSTYMTNAIAQSPTFELNDFRNKVYFYHMSLFYLGSSHRFSNHVNFDIQPESHLRQAYLSYQYQSMRYRFNTYFNRLSAEDYRLQQDIQDSLAPSVVDTLSADFIQRLDPALSLEYKARLSQRSTDSLKRLLLLVGSRYRGLSRGRMSVGGFVGSRQNYLSDDLLIDLQFDYFQQNYSVHIDQEISTRDYRDRDVSLTETKTYGELAFYFSDSFRGSAAYSLAQNEQATVNTLYVMMGYYFGRGTTSPLRRIAPAFEGL
jgi:hypothetical protein